LRRPGADIVGFEHAARTARQKAALIAGQANSCLRRRPSSSFLARRAVSLAEARVDIEAGEHEHEEAKAGARQQSRGGRGRPFQFPCRVRLQLQGPGSHHRHRVCLLQAFAGAQKLEVNVITPKGQTKFDVTRAKARIDLAGMM
jgi:hypothetical protein